MSHICLLTPKGGRELTADQEKQLGEIVAEFACTLRAECFHEGGWYLIYGEADELMLDRLRGLEYVAEAVVIEQSGEFEMWIDPGAAAEDDLVELFGAMSDLYRACGGKGLTFARESKENPVVVSSAL